MWFKKENKIEEITEEVLVDGDDYNRTVLTGRPFSDYECELLLLKCIRKYYPDRILVRGRDANLFVLEGKWSISELVTYKVLIYDGVEIGKCKLRSKLIFACPVDKKEEK